MVIGDKSVGTPQTPTLDQATPTSKGEPPHTTIVMEEYHGFEKAEVKKTIVKSIVKKANRRFTMTNYVDTKLSSQQNKTSHLWNYQSRDLSPHEDFRSTNQALPMQQ